MQVIGAHTLRRAGPSISAPTTPAAAEPMQGIALEKTERYGKKESCKPRCLSKVRGHAQTPYGSATSPEPASSTKALCSEIDDFLDEVASEGYVLKHGESAIASRMEQLELREHILSPVSDSSECPGGCDAMSLTYSLPCSSVADAGAPPRVKRETKPALDAAVSEVPEVPAKSQERARPSVAWSRLGSRGYYFAGDGKALWK